MKKYKSKMATVIPDTLDKLAINIASFILVISDVLSFWIRMYINDANNIIDNAYSISNTVFHFGIKLGIIIILIRYFLTKNTTPVLFSLVYFILSFIIYGIDEMCDILSKTTWSINILIVSTLISFIWYFVKQLRTSQRGS